MIRMAPPVRGGLSGWKSRPGLSLRPPSFGVTVQRYRPANGGFLIAGNSAADRKGVRPEDGHALTDAKVVRDCRSQRAGGKNQGQALRADACAASGINTLGHFISEQPQRSGGEESRSARE